MIKTAIIAWWFVIATNGQTVGPFATQSECQRIRDELHKIKWVSSCWSDQR